MKKGLFFSYCKSCWKRMTAYAAFLLIFIVVYALYRLPLEPVLYALLLVCVLAFFLFAADYRAFARKHRQLGSVLATLSAGLDKLPPPDSPLEEDYQCLLEALARQTRELSSRLDGRLSEMTDYYTLWAHQIKTPISAMRLLLQGDASQPGRRELEQQLFQIEQYVEMVLHFLRLESMSSDLLLKEYDLSHLVKQAVKKYAPVFIHKKIAVELGELSCPVLTDEKWLSFVLEQLLSNALKYTKEGKIRLFLDPQSPSTLVIQDTGIGIREEDLPRIFERGFTGYNGRMDKRSTGIGLYLCRKITQKLHHTISIESQPGQGTVVRLGLAHEHLDLI